MAGLCQTYWKDRCSYDKLGTVRVKKKTNKFLDSGGEKGKRKFSILQQEKEDISRRIFSVFHGYFSPYFSAKMIILTW